MTATPLSSGPAAQALQRQARAGALPPRGICGAPPRVATEIGSDRGRGTVPGLAHIIEDFDRRQAIRRRILAHLAIDLPQERCAEFPAPLRHTPLACARCPRPAACEDRIDRGAPGAPAFGRARGSFRALRTAAPPCPSRRRPDGFRFGSRHAPQPATTVAKAPSRARRVRVPGPARHRHEPRKI